MLKAPRSEPKSDLGQVLNVKLGCFAVVSILLGPHTSRVENSGQVLSNCSTCHILSVTQNVA